MWHSFGADTALTVILPQHLVSFTISVYAMTTTGSTIGTVPSSTADGAVTFNASAVVRGVTVSFFVLTATS